MEEMLKYELNCESLPPRCQELWRKMKRFKFWLRHFSPILGRSRWRNLIYLDTNHQMLSHVNRFGAKTFKINHCSTLFITESAFVGNTLFDVSIAQGLSWLWLTLVIESTLVIFNTFLLLSILIFELEWVAKEPREPVAHRRNGGRRLSVNSCRSSCQLLPDEPSSCQLLVSELVLTSGVRARVNFWCPSLCQLLVSELVSTSGVRACVKFWCPSSCQLLVSELVSTSGVRACFNFWCPSLC